MATMAVSSYPPGRLAHATSPRNDLDRRSSADQVWLQVSDDADHFEDWSPESTGSGRRQSRGRRRGDAASPPAVCQTRVRRSIARTMTSNATEEDKDDNDGCEDARLSRMVRLDVTR